MGRLSKAWETNTYLWVVILNNSRGDESLVCGGDY